MTKNGVEMPAAAIEVFCRKWCIAELALFGRSVDLVEKPALRNPIRRNAILAEQEVVYVA